MEKFEPATCDHGTWRQHLAAIKAAGGTKENAQESWGYLKRCEYFRSDTYQVAVDKTPSHGFGDVELWHLSFKRNDREAFHDWRVAQWIKNEICGEEAEGIEIYPAESRRVDTSNQYHLWVFITPGHRIPCGWNNRLVIDSDDDEKRGGVFSALAPDAKQRPLGKPKT